MSIKKSLLFVPAIAMAIAFALPAQAELMMPGNSGQQQGTQSANIQGRVLGATTYKVDVNGDGVVNSFDSAVLVAHWGQNFPAADLNGDGIVNSADFSILSSWWFATK